jgi:hypothetical protein
MKHLLPICAAAGILLCGSAFSQETTKTKSKPETPREHVIRVFLETSPAIGQSVLGLGCLDETGDPFEFQKLEGRYSVLTFGCLT